MDAMSRGSSGIVTFSTVSFGRLPHWGGIINSDQLNKLK
jgi:hypothetical protein